MKAEVTCLGEKYALTLDTRNVALAGIGRIQHRLSEKEALELLEALALCFAEQTKLPEGWIYSDALEVVGPNPEWDGASFTGGVLEVSRSCPPEVERALMIKAKLASLAAAP